MQPFQSLCPTGSDPIGPAIFGACPMLSQVGYDGQTCCALDNSFEPEMFSSGMMQQGPAGFDGMGPGFMPGFEGPPGCCDNNLPPIDLMDMNMPGPGVMPFGPF
ncbi:hypothetical protein WR25_17999 [Diploscapter pachys]|uniref:Uncharacterized protein n=1 Tax=Diploscapter pachys TaxID=2018661 RepID=A0A2A2JFV2_9BILA|nr:hypothetical protein WR25_17999 [Diploscapter pachys]